MQCWDHGHFDDEATVGFDMIHRCKRITSSTSCRSPGLFCVARLRPKYRDARINGVIPWDATPNIGLEKRYVWVRHHGPTGGRRLARMQSKWEVLFLVVTIRALSARRGAPVDSAVLLVDISVPAWWVGLGRCEVGGRHGRGAGLSVLQCYKPMPRSSKKFSKRTSS